jgi:hypothetical protein
VAGLTDTFDTTCSTCSVVVPVTLPALAVITAVPGARAMARPVAFTATMSGCDEDQPTSALDTSAWFRSRATAVSWIPWSSAVRVSAPGVTVIEATLSSVGPPPALLSPQPARITNRTPRGSRRKQ